MLSLNTSLRCLLRVWLMGAAMTTRGMQHIGLLFVLDPALSSLHKDEQSLREARTRYLGHINTHPFMAPILVGLLLNLEGLVASHKIPAQSMQKFIHTTSETFSAIGDSFFSGTFIIFWTLTTTLLILNDYILTSIFWTGFLLALLLLFRVWFFFLGLKNGLMVLTKIRKLNLINQGYSLKLINALLIAAIYWTIYHNTNISWVSQFVGVILLILGAILVNTVHISRVIFAALLCLILAIH